MNAATRASNAGRLFENVARVRGRGRNGVQKSKEERSAPNHHAGENER